MTTSETIYLLDMGDEIVWCDQPDPDNDDRNPVRYVRADVVEAENKRLEGELEAARREAAGMRAEGRREALLEFAGRYKHTAIQTELLIRPDSHRRLVDEGIVQGLDHVWRELEAAAGTEQDA